MQPGRGCKAFKTLQAELHIFKGCQAAVGKGDIFGNHIILHHPRLNMVGTEVQHRLRRGKNCIDRNHSPAVRARIITDQPKL